MGETRSIQQIAEHLLIVADHPDLDAHAEQVLREAADVLIEAERRGAERMRERAARLMIDLGHVSESGETLALEIRALPLTEETSDAE